MNEEESKADDRGWEWRGISILCIETYRKLSAVQTPRCVLQNINRTHGPSRQVVPEGVDKLCPVEHRWFLCNRSDTT